MQHNQQNDSAVDITETSVHMLPSEAEILRRMEDKKPSPREILYCEFCDVLSNHCLNSDELNRRQQLVQAVKAGNIGQIGSLLDAGVNPNIHEWCIRETASAGKEVYLNSGKTPLYIAAESGKNHIVKLLLEHGANPAIQSNNYDYPLSIAAYYRHTAVIDELSHHRDDSTQMGVGADLALYRVAGWKQANDNIQLDTAEKLYTNFHADIDHIAVFPCGPTPLHVSSERGGFEMCRWLVDHKADLNARDNCYGTPLHRSAYNGHFEIVKLLLDAGANPTL